MTQEPFKADPTCIACQQCKVENKENNCEYKCPVCGRIVSKCYVVDNVCIICKTKGKG